VKTPVMAVNNESQREEAGDYRSRPRWSAGKKMEVVLRLLRGESLEELSQELQVEAHRLAAWRDDFLEGGKKARPLAAACQAASVTRSAYHAWTVRAHGDRLSATGRRPGWSPRSAPST
jgi:transposase-like protein